MEIPDPVRAELGNEDVYAGVSLGSEDVLCFTPTRSLVYRSEGLLSDEQVESYPHDVEGLHLSQGRRKAKFVFEYIDERRTLKVPVDRSDPVLERLLEGVLRTGNVIGAEESVEGTFRFSELTLIITDQRLLKRVGEQVWKHDDFESYHYEEVTGLNFEQGSVATQVVIEVDGRPQRIKAPNDQAQVVRQTLERSLFTFHGVDSLEEFNRRLGTEPASEESPSDSDVDFGSGIDPLGSAPAEESGADATPGSGARADAPSDPGVDADGDATERAPEPTDATGAAEEAGTADAIEPARDSGRSSGSSAARSDDEPPRRSGGGNDADDRSEGGASATHQPTSRRSAPDPEIRDDVEELAETVEELVETVEEQTELVREQHRAIQQLIDVLDDR